MAKGFGMSNRALPLVPVNAVTSDPQSAEESGMWPQNGPDDPGPYQGEPDQGEPDQAAPPRRVVAAGGHRDRMRMRRRAQAAQPDTVPGEGVYRDQELD